MTSRSQRTDLPSPLCTGLHERLGAGVGPVLNAGRAAFAEVNDELAWKNVELAEGLANLGEVQRESSHVNQASALLAACFAAQPHTLRALVHRPEVFLTKLPDLLERVSGDGPTFALRDTHQWRLFAGAVDLLWDFLQSDRAAARKHRHLFPLVARTRFLALSEPFRHPDNEVWEQGTGDLSRVFGHNTPDELERRAQDAREVWRARLNGHQSTPLLDHAPPLAVEDELRVLAFASGFGGEPLVLTAPGGDDRALEVPPLDRAVVEEVIETHLLPRFAVAAVWKAVLGRGRTRYAKTNPWLFIAVAATALFAIPTAAAAVSSGCPRLLLVALGAAAVVYALIGWGTLTHGRLWAMPLMLRLPAASAVGLILLIALHPDWWTGARNWVNVLWPVLLLVSVSFGYLLIEARNHNSGQPSGNKPRGRKTKIRILGRALAVTGVGAVHAVLVAFLGMVVIAPAFSENGDRLQAVWNLPWTEAPAAEPEQSPQAPTPGCAECADTDNDAPPPTDAPWAILLTAAAWCLAAGVFSQILWDDQPITAPLSHRRWRAER